MHPAQHPASMVRHGVLMLAAGLCLAAAVAIWALLTGSFDGTSVRILLTGLAAALCTVGGLAGSTALGLTGPDRRAGEMTIGLSQLSLLLALVLIWAPGAADGVTLPRALGVTSALTLAGAHASLLLARRRPRDRRVVVALTHAAIACAISSALLVSGLFASSLVPVPAVVWRLLGVLVVLALLTTLLVPLARRITRDRGDAHEPGPAARSTPRA